MVHVCNNIIVDHDDNVSIGYRFMMTMMRLNSMTTMVMVTVMMVMMMKIMMVT